MRLLLDTHALLWWLAGDSRLPARTKRAIGDRRNEILVSAASAWEVATKYRLGKLPGAGPLGVDFSGEIGRQGFTPLAITLEHAEVAGGLIGAHRDPFDRMLVAQARAERMAIVSNDAVFDDFGVPRVW